MKAEIVSEGFEEMFTQPGEQDQKSYIMNKALQKKLKTQKSTRKRQQEGIEQGKYGLRRGENMLWTDFKAIALLGVGEFGKVYLTKKMNDPFEGMIFALKQVRVSSGVAT